MKIEILMLKENNERGVRMMFLSLEQLQKLKLNPTRADYEIAYETEVKEQEGTQDVLRDFVFQSIRCTPDLSVDARRIGQLTQHFFDSYSRFVFHHKCHLIS